MTAEKIGATGRFPQGKLDDSDEGELTIAISRDGDIVRIHFGKPVAWLAMTREAAAELALLILEHARR